MTGPLSIQGVPLWRGLEADPGTSESLNPHVPLVLGNVGRRLVGGGGEGGSHCWQVVVSQEGRRAASVSCGKRVGWPCSVRAQPAGLSVCVQPF